MELSHERLLTMHCFELPSSSRVSLFTHSCVLFYFVHEIPKKKKSPPVTERPGKGRLNWCFLLRVECHADGAGERNSSQRTRLTCGHSNTGCVTASRLCWNWTAWRTSTEPSLSQNRTLLPHGLHFAPAVSALQAGMEEVRVKRPPVTQEDRAVPSQVLQGPCHPGTVGNSRSVT